MIREPEIMPGREYKVVSPKPYACFVGGANDSYCELRLVRTWYKKIDVSICVCMGVEFGCGWLRLLVVCGYV